MAPVPAHRALGYALSREIIGVYLVLLTGLLLFLAVPEFLYGAPHLLRRLLVVLVRVVGFALFYVGLIALLYKVIADATAEA